jgi:hypothetical protein
MAKTAEKVERPKEVYSFTGSLIEACSCNVLCPCWIGEDPDLGDCRTFLSFHIDSGRIKTMDVSNLSVVIVAYVPGNILAGNWDAVVLIDERATPEQREALLAAFGGQLGGPIADWAGLIGTVKGVEYVPISHRVNGGVGTLEIGEILDAQMEPYRNADGTVTTLRDSVFSTVPGSPAWVSKASRYRLSLPAYGWEWQFEGRNAIQSDWKMEHVA